MNTYIRNIVELYEERSVFANIDKEGFKYATGINDLTIPEMHIIMYTLGKRKMLNGRYSRRDLDDVYRSMLDNIDGWRTIAQNAIRKYRSNKSMNESIFDDENFANTDEETINNITKDKYNIHDLKDANEGDIVYYDDMHNKLIASKEVYYTDYMNYVFPLIGFVTYVDNSKVVIISAQYIGGDYYNIKEQHYRTMEHADYDEVGYPIIAVDDVDYELKEYFSNLGIWKMPTSTEFKQYVYDKKDLLNYFLKLFPKRFSKPYGDECGYYTKYKQYIELIYIDNFSVESTKDVDTPCYALPIQIINK